MSTFLPERRSLGARDVRSSRMGIARRGDPGKLPRLEAALRAGINFIDTAEIYL